jgi:membrane protease subunit HflK
VYANSNKVLMDSEGSGNLIYLPIDKLLEKNQSKQILVPNQSIDTPSPQNQNQDPRIRRVR